MKRPISFIQSSESQGKGLIRLGKSLDYSIRGEGGFPSPDLKYHPFYGPFMAFLGFLPFYDPWKTHFSTEGGRWGKPEIHA